jgi:hypothetical protein
MFSLILGEMVLFVRSVAVTITIVFFRRKNIGNMLILYLVALTLIRGFILVLMLELICNQSSKWIILTLQWKNVT